MTKNNPVNIFQWAVEEFLSADCPGNDADISSQDAGLWTEATLKAFVEFTNARLDETPLATISSRPGGHVATLTDGTELLLAVPQDAEQVESGGAAISGAAKKRFGDSDRTTNTFSHEITGNDDA